MNTSYRHLVSGLAFAFVAASTNAAPVVAQSVTSINAQLALSRKHAGRS